MCQSDYESLYQGMAPLLASKWLKGCSFADEFRSEWKRVLHSNAVNTKSFLPADAGAVFPVPHTYEGTKLTFRFNRLKLAEWFRLDTESRERRIFLPRNLTRNGGGELTYQASRCAYDPSAEEPFIPEDSRDILVCSLPGFPPLLQVVYGNRRVEGSFSGFRNRKLSIFLIQAEFTPAFLGDSFEMCAYLFWMDCCIMASNRVKVDDKRLKPLLHIFRSSSMLTLHGLV